MFVAMATATLVPIGYHTDKLHLRLELPSSCTPIQIYNSDAIHQIYFNSNMQPVRTAPLGTEVVAIATETLRFILLTYVQLWPV